MNSTFTVFWFGKGTVWVESDGVGKGSTFFIELPVGELGKKEVV